MVPVHADDRPGEDGEDGEAGHSGVRVDEQVDERAPLLGPHGPEARLDSRREQLRLRVTILAFVVIFLLELGIGMSVPPSSSIMEGIICEQMHPRVEHKNNTTWGQGGPDDPCKNPDVQSYLAMLRGWAATFDAIPGFLCAVPYGILSDRWGRRPVLVLGILGLTLNVCFTILVFLFSDIMPLWWTLFAAVFSFLGGGGQIVVAMLYTFLADVVPVADRATAFFQVAAAYLVSATVAAPLAGAIMTVSDWITLIISLVMLIFGLLVSMIMPETVSLHGQRERNPRRRARESEDVDDGNDGDDEADHDSEESPTAKRSFAQILKHKIDEALGDVKDFVLGNKRLAFLLLPVMFVVLGKFVQEMLLQYATKRYGWSWSRATLLLTIRGATSLVTLLVLLPFASWFCLSRLAMSGVSKDIQLARLSAAISVAGCLIIAVAANGYVVAGGIIVLSLGAGVSGLIRSLLNSLVEEHHMGIVNSLVGFMEMLGIMVAGPLLAQSLSTGMRLGGAWIGLPFLVSAVFMAFVTIILCIFRPPPGRS